MKVSESGSNPTSTRNASTIDVFQPAVAQARAMRAGLGYEMTNVFIVDDHEIFRDGLRALLESTGEITVVGDAASGKGLLEKLTETAPELVLMDIQMPGVNGIALTRQIKEQFPHVAVLMLTMFEDDESVFSAMQAGASGYVLKGISNSDMIASIRTAASGGAVFSPNVANYMLRHFRRAMQGEKPAESPPELSQRELDVLELIAAGADNATIARKLTLTQKTVRNYVSRVLKKLNVSSRTNVGDRAREIGYLD